VYEENDKQLTDGLFFTIKQVPPLHECTYVPNTSVKGHFGRTMVTFIKQNFHDFRSENSSTKLNVL